MNDCQLLFSLLEMKNIAHKQLTDKLVKTTGTFSQDIFSACSHFKLLLPGGSPKSQNLRILDANNRNKLRPTISVSFCCIINYPKIYCLKTRTSYLIRNLGAWQFVLG